MHAVRRIVPNAVADSTLPPMDNRKRWDAQIRDGRVCVYVSPLPNGAGGCMMCMSILAQKI
jgi:hypothetical protein